MNTWYITYTSFREKVFIGRWKKKKTCFTCRRTSQVRSNSRDFLFICIYFFLVAKMTLKTHKSCKKLDVFFVFCFCFVCFCFFFYEFFFWKYSDLYSNIFSWFYKSYGKIRRKKKKKKKSPKTENMGWSWPKKQIGYKKHHSVVLYIPSYTLNPNLLDPVNLFIFKRWDIQSLPSTSLIFMRIVSIIMICTCLFLDRV